MKSFSKIAAILLIAIFTLAFTAGHSVAQERGHKKVRVSPNASVSQTIGTEKITITYGRPGVKGREIFGGLVPYGHWWRTGANESTVIVLPKDVMIEGKSLKAGTYSLYTLPGKDKWTVIFNSKLSWGTEYDKNDDVLRVDVQPEEGSKMEQELIYFRNVTDNSAEVVIHWDTTKVPFTIKL